VLGHIHVNGGLRELLGCLETELGTPQEDDVLMVQRLLGDAEFVDKGPVGASEVAKDGPTL